MLMVTSLSFRKPDGVGYLRVSFTDLLESGAAAVTQLSCQAHPNESDPMD